jgi:hypothetical protein
VRPVTVPIEPPSCRATIRDGLLILNSWTPGLRGGRGPELSGFRTITAALADLRMHDDELIVTPVPRTAWTEDAEETVLAWASLVGYRRVWLPGRVVDLADALAPCATAASDCPTCGAHWEDGALSFWETVRGDGWFPGTCLACGGSLPEWRPVAAAEPVGDERPMDHHSKSGARGRDL